MWEIPSYCLRERNLFTPAGQACILCKNEAGIASHVDICKEMSKEMMMMMMMMMVTTTIIILTGTL
jgi:hypothetical protein